MKARYSTLRVEHDIATPMRDGTVLYADIYRPAARGRFPVILTRTPYDKAWSLSRVNHMDAERAAAQGYVTVVQDVRGRYSSGGEFNPFFQELDDGYDTVEWCASQPWSTGKVGMYGASYVGATQWLAAATGAPGLSCIVPRITSSDYHEGWNYQGGAFQLGFALSWTMASLTLANLPNISRRLKLPRGAQEDLTKVVDQMAQTLRFMPLKELPYLKKGLAPYYYDWVSHPRLDDYWKAIRIEEFYPKMTVSALNIGGWFDIFIWGTIRNYLGMREKGASEAARRSQKLVIGPWQHGSPLPSMAGEVYFGQAADERVIDLVGTHLRWYDYWLKGEDNGILDEPPVNIFVMGDNVWRQEMEWPLARARYTRYFLHSGGRANTLNGDGLLSPEPPKASEPPDLFMYDPRNPVPSRGGSACCFPGFVPMGPLNQQEVETRPDVLCYTTPPLEEDMEVTGPVTITLYASTSAPDTDFTTKLVDVFPCGRALSLTDGIVRARYREGTTRARPIEPGKLYRYDIDMVATSNVFKKGHRIRLEVSSSNFPRFDRNPNTGREPWEEAELRPALQTVFHDGEYASHITLPVIPRGPRRR